MLVPKPLLVPVVVPVLASLLVRGPQGFLKAVKAKALKESTASRQRHSCAVLRSASYDRSAALHRNGSNFAAPVRRVEAESKHFQADSLHFRS